MLSWPITKEHNRLPPIPSAIDDKFPRKRPKQWWKCSVEWRQHGFRLPEIEMHCKAKTRQKDRKWRKTRCQLTPCIAAASADNREQSAPVLLEGWSNQPISCFSMASKANFRIRSVKCSPATVNIATCNGKHKLCRSNIKFLMLYGQNTTTYWCSLYIKA